LVICSEKKNIYFHQGIFSHFQFKCSEYKTMKVTSFSSSLYHNYFLVAKNNFLGFTFTEKKVSNQSLHIIVFSFHFVKGN